MIQLRDEHIQRYRKLKRFVEAMEELELDFEGGDELLEDGYPARFYSFDEMHKDCAYWLGFVSEVVRAQAASELAELEYDCNYQSKEGVMSLIMDGHNGPNLDHQDVEDLISQLYDTGILPREGEKT